jgi:hypothetical protein
MREITEIAIGLTKTGALAPEVKTRRRKSAVKT